MKQYLPFLLVLIILLVVPVSANTALNFQQPADFIEHVTVSTAPVYWVQSTTGGDNYVKMWSAKNGGGSSWIQNSEPSPMTYAAFSLQRSDHSGYGSVTCVLLDVSGATMDTLNNLTIVYEDSAPHWVELRVVGGTGMLYMDGVLLDTSVALNQNPSYVRWHVYYALASDYQPSFDDMIWGSSEPLLSTASDKYVYNMPETTAYGEPYYYLMKDFINPAASGFYKGDGTLINSYSFTSSFSKGNNNNDTIYLQGYTTGVNVLANYTGTAYTGTITWDLTSFFASNPNYGFYAMHSPSSLKYSDLLLYIGGGATISWSKDTYSQGESGAIISAVLDGGYWDPAIYNYRVDIFNIYGEVQATYPVTTQTSTISHTWDADQAIGLYYAAIIATPVAGGEDIWMNAAYCNVDAYLHLSGYVFDAETTNPINGANVNITQGISVNNVVVPADGNYSISGLAQGSTISINVSATGYETYLHQFTPLRVGALELNFTLMPLNPTYYGIALGGIAREPPYNRTIGNAYIDIQNASAPYGNYTVQTNAVGYYIKDYMPNNYWWNIWGSKTGFLNSTIYQKLVVGI